MYVKQSVHGRFTNRPYEEFLGDKVDGGAIHESPVVALVATLLFVLTFATSASALPWDQDLFKQDSLKANEIARNPVPGTVPVGAKPFRMTADEAAEKLSNPTKADENSLARGKRLWSTNCLPCHGEKGDSLGVPAGPLMAAPSLLSDFYKAREDGRIFAVIHNGGANMPAYGHKINHEEKWDIVNYLRYLQGLVK